MRVEIWSDVVCPWCYLGKRRFERALSGVELPAAAEIVHRSFQLDPSRPQGSVSSRRSMLMGKYGLSETEVKALDSKMERTAAGDGLEFHLTESGLTGNTLDAHRLVHMAGDRGLSGQMLDRLYAAYFTEQRSLFDVESLAGLAADAGIDEGEARDALQGNLWADAVARDLDEARALGITGVPFFVLDRRYAVSGAQSVEVFRQALTRAAEGS
jgi:predicted DsbA family dithiol-disulfide isomerase